MPARDRVFATEISDILGLKSGVFLWHVTIPTADKRTRNTGSEHGDLYDEPIVNTRFFGCNGCHSGGRSPRFFSQALLRRRADLGKGQRVSASGSPWGARHPAILRGEPAHRDGLE